MRMQPWSAGGQDRRQPFWRRGRVWFGLLLSIASLVLAVQGISLDDVLRALRDTSLGWLAVGVALVLLSVSGKAMRWRILLRASQFSQRPRRRRDPPASEPAAASNLASLEPIRKPLPHPVPECGNRPEDGPQSRFSDRHLEPGEASSPVGVARLTRIWLAGAALNLALPAPRSGDLARAYLAGEAGQTSKSLVLGTIVAEKLLDLVMLAVSFLGLVPFVALPQELLARQGSVIGMTVALLVAVMLVLWQRHRLLKVARWVLAQLPARWGQPLLSSTERAMQGLEALRSPRAVLLLIFWSAIVWLLAAAVNYVVFLAQGLPPSWIQAVFVLVVLQAGVAVPSSPGKIGLFQVLCRWALSFFGVAAAAGLAYGILLYLVAVVSQMALGALALMWESWLLHQQPTAVYAVLAGAEEPSKGAVGGGP